MDQILDTIYWGIVTGIGMGVIIGLALLAMAVDGVIAKENEKRREREGEE